MYQTLDGVLDWGDCKSSTQPIVAEFIRVLDGCTKGGVVVLPPAMDIGTAVAIVCCDNARTAYDFDGRVLVKSDVTAMGTVAQHLYRLLVDDLGISVNTEFQDCSQQDAETITALRHLLV